MQQSIVEWMYYEMERIHEWLQAKEEGARLWGDSRDAKEEGAKLLIVTKMDNGVIRFYSIPA